MKKTKILVFVLLVALCLSCFAACNKTPQELVDARDYLYNQYKEFDGKATPADFNRVGAVMINGTKYPIEWTVEVKTEGQSESVKVVKNEDGTVTVDVDEKAAVEISYDLVATISNAKGKTITVTFHHTVPQWRELTWAEYMATEKGQAVVIKGKVASISSKSTGDKYNLMYIYDNDGGYYVYSLTEDPLTTYPNLALGMTVQVTGEKDIYNGTHEVKNATFTVIDAESTIEFADITDIFAATDDMKSETLTKKAYMPVTIKNVIIGDIDAANSYYYFTIGASKSYLRISSSDNMLSEAETKAFKDGFAALKGKYATVKGLATVYSGSFYIQVITADAAVEQAAPEKDPAGQIADVKGRLAIDTKINGSGRTFTLPTQDTVYTSVNIAWAASSEVAKIEDGKVTYTFTEDGTVKLTATLTHATDATVSDTKEFVVTLSVGTPVTVAEFLQKAVSEDEIYILTGFIVADAEDSKAGSFVFADDTGAVFSYNKFDVAVGDKVKIVATRAVNSGLPQLGTLSVTKLDKAEGESYTYPEATELAAADIDLSALSNAKMDEMDGTFYKITGTILYKSDKYFNAGTVGATAGEYNQLLSVYTASSLVDENLLGKEVVIYGYVRGFSANKYLTVQVVRITEKDKTDAEKLAEAKEALTSVTADGGSEFADSFTLVTEGANGTKISWAIKEEGITALTIDGANATVVKPEANVNVTLIATISLEGSSEAPVTKEFPITITATIPTYTVTVTEVEGATIVVKNGETVVESGATFNKGTELTITVTLDETHILNKVMNGEATLTAEEDGTYKLTLTANANITVDVTACTVVTVAEFLEKAVGNDLYMLTGFIVADGADEGEGSFVFADGTGAVFSYNKFDVAVGDKVKIVAKRAANAGLPQLGTQSVTKLEKAEGESYTYPAATELAAADIDLSALNNAKMDEMDGTFYKITGTILYKSGSYTSAGTAGATAGTYNQILSLYTADSLVDQNLLGQEVIVYGYVRGFKTGKYLTIQIVKIEAKPQKTDAEKVAEAKEALTLDVTTTGVSFKLPVVGLNDAVITWASDNEAVISINGEDATVISPAAETVVKLTATITIGEASDTKEFNVTVTVTIPEFDVTVTQPEVGGTLEVKNGEAAFGGGKVQQGTKLTISATLAPNYEIVAIKVNGEALTAVEGVYSVTVTEAIEITVELKEIKFATVTFGEVENGTLTVKDGTADVATGASVKVGTVLTITATANSGYKVSAVKVNGTAITGNTYTVLDTDTAVAITVETAVYTQEDIVNDAYKLAADTTLGEFTLTGVIVSVDTAYDSGYKNVTVTIVVEGLTDKPIKCFRLKGEGADVIAVNDTITVTGTIKNYGGTVEFDSGCTFTDRVIGNSTISVAENSSDKATVTFENTSGQNGTTVNFTVAVSEGYELVSVKVNGVVVEAVEGTYTATFKGNLSVLVETKEAGTATATVVASLTFPDGNSKSVSSYVDTWSATCNNIQFNIANFNNNKNGWAYIKCGSKKAASIATISTAAAMADKVTKVIVTIDKVTASAVNSIKLVVATDADFKTVVEEVEGTVAVGDMTFNVSADKQAENLYYKVVFDCAQASNGTVQVSKVDFYAVK